MPFTYLTWIFYFLFEQTTFTEKERREKIDLFFKVPHVWTNIDEDEPTSPF